MVVIGVGVCAGGLQNGLERVTKVMMIALLAIMVVLAINSFFMAGAKEGLRFYLVPDFGRMQEVGVVATLVGAMNQAFFTLSLREDFLRLAPVSSMPQQMMFSNTASTVDNAANAMNRKNRLPHRRP